MKQIKNLLFICVALFGFLMLAGCVIEDNECVHETGSWAANVEEHWKTCGKCNEQVEKGAHNFGEYEVTIEPAVGVDGLKVRKCADCGYVDRATIPAIVVNTGVAEGDFAVYAKVPADWASANCYYFGEDSNALPNTTGWPGSAMTLVNADENIWGFVVPAGTGYVIFNNGLGVQTIDLLFATELNLYTLTDTVDGKFVADYGTYTPAEDQPELNKYPSEIAPVEYYTVYAQLPATWTAPNAHWWGADDTSWPGNPLVNVEGNVWTIDVPKTASGLIFNNGGEQTQNIEAAGGLHSGNAYIVNDDFSFKAVNYADGEFTELRYIVYAQLPATWTAPCAHYWGSESTSWPGVALENVEGNVWKLEVSKGITGLIFNGNGQQTANIEAVNGLHKGNAYVVSDDCKFVVSNYNDGVFTPVELETPVITDCYIKGSMNEWSDNDAFKFTYDEATDTATLTLEIAADAEFKVTIGTGWSKEFNSSSATYDATQFGGSGNIVCLVAGTYVLTVTNVTGEAPALTIALA